MTNCLIKNITVLDKNSEYNGKKINILIKDGNAQFNSSQIDLKDIEELDFSGFYITQGFCDLYVNINDPGFEYREDIESVANAAIAGGFTTICATANNHPITQSKAQVEYIINNAKNTPTKN